MNRTISSNDLNPKTLKRTKNNHQRNTLKKVAKKNFFFRKTHLVEEEFVDGVEAVDVGEVIV